MISKKCLMRFQNFFLFIVSGYFCRTDFQKKNIIWESVVKCGELTVHVQWHGRKLNKKQQNCYKYFQDLERVVTSWISSVYETKNCITANVQVNLLPKYRFESNFPNLSEIMF